MHVAVKIFRPKNMYVYIYICTHTYTGVGCQMSPLLADPGTRWTRTAESWVAGSSSYSLDHGILVKRTILILELPHELRSRNINRKFFNPSSCRQSVSNC
jgi:uncharacterized membrane protein